MQARTARWTIGVSDAVSSFHGNGTRWVAAAPNGPGRIRSPGTPFFSLLLPICAPALARAAVSNSEAVGEPE